MKAEYANSVLISTAIPDILRLGFYQSHPATPLSTDEVAAVVIAMGSWPRLRADIDEAVRMAAEEAKTIANMGKP